MRAFGPRARGVRIPSLSGVQGCEGLRDISPANRSLNAACRCTARGRPQTRAPTTSRQPPTHRSCRARRPIRRGGFVPSGWAKPSAVDDAHVLSAAMPWRGLAPLPFQSVHTRAVRSRPLTPAGGAARSAPCLPTAGAAAAPTAAGRTWAAAARPAAAVPRTRRRRRRRRRRPRRARRRRRQTARCAAVR
jgi:hypothetical protein